MLKKTICRFVAAGLVAAACLMISASTAEAFVFRPGATQETSFREPDRTPGVFQMVWRVLTSLWGGSGSSSDPNG